MSQREQVAITSRVFCLAAIFGVALLSRDAATLQSVLAVCLVGALSAYVAYATGRTHTLVLTAETIIVGLIMGTSFPGSAVLMPYLVVLPLLFGIFRGFSGVALAIFAEAAALVVVPLAADGFTGAMDRLLTLLPWLLTNFGGGLLGVWARNLGDGPAKSENIENYESARQLLTQLRAVTRKLSVGLDHASMAEQLMRTVHERLEDANTAVFVNMRGSVLVPIGYRGTAAQRLIQPNDAIVEQCWEEATPVHGVVASGSREGRHRVAMPLHVGNRMIGVVVSTSPVPLPSDDVHDLMPEIDEQSLRLDAALVFDEIRTMATTDERQRLAREIHDGIAQEIASIGYVVDGLTATSTDPRVITGLRGLRSELSRVVGDLRLSIFDLRTDVSAAGLGAALSDYVRQVGTKSDMTVHLTLNEAPTRLAPAVEAELLRIAQEAITNARKHAEARNLWVDVETQPPFAALTIRDDGKGMGTGRDDSYGLSIMRERARRVDAELTVSDANASDGARGTVVHVSLSAQGALTPESR